MSETRIQLDRSKPFAECRGDRTPEDPLYRVAAWQGGKLAQRYGCIRMLYMGCCGIILSLTLGMVLTTPTTQIMVFCLWTVGVCFIWPALETLIGDRAGAELAKMVGIYNVTWATGGSLAACARVGRPPALAGGAGAVAGLAGGGTLCTVTPS